MEDLIVRLWENPGAWLPPAVIVLVVIGAWLNDRRRSRRSVLGQPLSPARYRHDLPPEGEA